MGRRPRLRGACRRAAQDAVLYMESRACGCGVSSGKRGDVYAHPHGVWHASSRRTEGLPPRSAAGLWWCQVRLAKIPRKSRSAIGKAGLRARDLVPEAVELRGLAMTR